AGRRSQDPRGRLARAHRSGRRGGGRTIFGGVNAGLYSVRDVARIFGLHERRLRYWAQTGFVGPSQRQGGRALYTFEDLIGVKVAKELLDGGLPLQRVRRNLDALRSALPEVTRPLAR